MMSHLTIDEIIDFVSVDEFNDESRLLISKVNEHIRSCGECLNMVKSFQVVYDKFVDLNNDDTFRKQCYEYLTERNADASVPQVTFEK